MATSPKYDSLLFYFKDSILYYFTLSISNSLNLGNIIDLSSLTIHHVQLLIF